MRNPDYNESNYRTNVSLPAPAGSQGEALSEATLAGGVPHVSWNQHAVRLAWPNSKVRSNCGGAKRSPYARSSRFERPKSDSLGKLDFESIVL